MHPCFSLVTDQVSQGRRNSRQGKGEAMAGISPHFSYVDFLLPMTSAVQPFRVTRESRRSMKGSGAVDLRGSAHFLKRSPCVRRHWNMPVHRNVFPDAMSFVLASAEVVLNRALPEVARSTSRSRPGSESCSTTATAHGERSPGSSSRF